MSQTIERRFRKHASLRIVAEEKGRPKTIAGDAVVYNSLSDDLGGFHEMIMPGCFAESLKTADVRCLVDHDPSKILGRNRSKTLRLSDSAKSLEIECDLGNQSYALDLLESMEREDVDGMSFGFFCLEDTWETTDIDGQTRTLRRVHKAEIFDVSAVTYPAYTDTSVALRSLDGWKKQQVEERGTVPVPVNDAPQTGPKIGPEIERLRLRLELQAKTN